VPSFAIIKPAIDNTYVDFSPYGQSIYADAIGAVKAVDLSWDAIQNETELSKMRVFIGDLLLDEAIDKDGKTRYLPFGDDDVIFRKVAQGDATRDLIETFAPALRSRDYIDTYHMNWQTLGDLCGFGLEYFAVDKTGGLRTATEVSADNSALMRNIRKHENALEKALRSIIQAIVNASVTILGNPSSMAELGEIKIQFDDSIITDTTAEKAQDMLEVDRTLNAWEYRVKWYGETEEEAKANVPNSGIELIDYEA
jgi:A118 family predicted phage portal protein